MSIQRFARVAVLSTAVAFLIPSAGLALSTFSVNGGQLTTVQFVDPSGTPVPCPIGGNVSCLAAPAPINGGTLTLDVVGNQLVSMAFQINGPATLNLGGVHGYSSVQFSNASFQTNGPSAVTPLGGGNFNFGPATGTVTTDLVLNPTSGPAIVVNGASFASAPSGTIFTSGNGLNLSLQGVDLGQVCDPTNPKQCLFVKADFNLTATAAIPEPTAALTFGIGALLVAAGAKRRQASRA